MSNTPHKSFLAAFKNDNKEKTKLREDMLKNKYIAAFGYVDHFNLFMDWKSGLIQFVPLPVDKEGNIIPHWDKYRWIKEEFGDEITIYSKPKGGKMNASPRNQIDKLMLERNAQLMELKDNPEIKEHISLTTWAFNKLWDDRKLLVDLFKSVVWAEPQFSKSQGVRHLAIYITSCMYKELPSDHTVKDLFAGEGFLNGRPLVMYQNVIQDLAYALAYLIPDHEEFEKKIEKLSAAELDTRTLSFGDTYLHFYVHKAPVQADVEGKPTFGEREGGIIQVIQDLWKDVLEKSETKKVTSKTPFDLRLSFQLHALTWNDYQFFIKDLLPVWDSVFGTSKVKGDKTRTYSFVVFSNENPDVSRNKEYVRRYQLGNVGIETETFIFVPINEFPHARLGCVTFTFRIEGSELLLYPHNKLILGFPYFWQKIQSWISQNKGH
jgi:hypothetical protein